MKKYLLVLAAILGVGSTWAIIQRAQAAAPSTKPATQPAAQASTLPMDVRANSAFDKGDYETAIMLYQRLMDTEKDARKRAAYEERFRVCQKEVLKKASPQDLQELAGQRNPDETSPEKRKKHVLPRNGQAYEALIKDLGNFEYDSEKGGNIPDDVQKLSGAKVRTRGFMIPLDQADNITEFALVPSLFACCFGQPPQLQHTIIVKTPKGKAVSYFPEEIIVEGTFKVEERKEDDVIVSVFEMECNSVKPAPQN
jgi:hypothetical protein